MKTIKVLANQNKLCNEITTNASYSDQKEDFSIRVAFNGSERFRIGKKNFTIHPGNFLVVNEGTVFSSSIYSDIPANTFSVLYSQSYLSAFHAGITKTDPALLDDPFCKNCGTVPIFMETIYPFSGDMMFNLLHLKDHYDSGHHNDMLINEYLHYCLFNFYQLYNKEVLVKKEQLNVLNRATKAELFKRLTNAKDYMLSNYNQSISIEEISRHACLSEIHFFRTFKQIFNCSPHQYLVQSRLNNARHMLKTTSYSLSEIVTLIGFDNTSSFIRLFKDRFGNTPGSYRVKLIA